MPDLPLVHLTRRSTFAAAHRLADPALDQAANDALFGKCASPGGHGHNYVLTVTLRGTVEPGTGMLINLVDLQQAVQDGVLDAVDHKNLNQDVAFLQGVNPTVENLVVAFWNRLSDTPLRESLYEVGLQETENNWASYRGERAQKGD